MNPIVLACIAASVVILYKIVQLLIDARKPPPPEAKWQIGNITLHSLRFHNGMDYSKPLLIAIKGVVYDATNSMGEKYGPGRPQHVYAGREVARALAKDSLEPEDCSDALEGLTPEQLERLEQQVKHFRSVYDEVGKVIPMRQMTMAELAEGDGKDPSKPIFIAIRGVVYDVSTGRQFYGPDGIYPFAGKEVARAFALISTELSDCNDDLEGLGVLEMQNLQEWESKFNWKYPVVGKIVK